MCLQAALKKQIPRQEGDLQYGSCLFQYTFFSILYNSVSHYRSRFMPHFNLFMDVMGGGGYNCILPLMRSIYI